MSQEIVKGLKATVDWTFDLLDKFIEACPEKVWTANNGAWPVWQEIYHAISSVGFFVLPADAVGPAPLVDAEVAGLDKVGANPITKSQAKNALAVAKGLADQYADSLSDKILAKRNEGAFQRAEMEMSHAETMSSLAAHNLYHLGAGDTALRVNGLKGVF